MMEDHDNSFEPMDIDISTNSNNKMDISYGDLSIEIKQEHHIDTSRVNSDTFETFAERNIKKFHINIKKNGKFRNILKIKIFTALFILLISVIVFNISVNCSDINLENLRNTLSTQVIGQSKAVDSIIEALKEKNKLILFYGSTGVGKTYTASLLMANFGYSSNLYHYTSSNFVHSMSTNLMIGFILCPNSLIIVDDCDINDNIFTKEVYDLIIKSEDLGKSANIILIYNCDNIGHNFEKECDKEFYSKLLMNFSNNKVMKKIIKFEPLSKLHLRKCIENEIGNESTNDQAYKLISSSFDVSVDGCKGVHNKIKLLNIV